MSLKITATTRVPLKITATLAQPELEFVPYVNATASGSFWNRHVDDQQGEVRLSVRIVGPDAPDDVVLTFTLSGTAVEGINYKVLTPSPLTIPKGQEKADIVLLVLDPGLYHAERELSVKVGSAVNAHTSTTTRDEFKLFIRSTADKPTLDFNAASSTSAYDDASIVAQVVLSELCLDDVRAYIRVGSSSTADADDYTLTEATVTAGSLTANVDIDWTGSAPGAGDTIIANIENSTLALANIWSFSEDLVTPEGPEYPVLGSATIEDVKQHAAYPTDHLYKDANPQDYGWSCTYPVPTEGTTPDTRSSAGRFELSGTATETAKIGKTFTGNFQDALGNHAGASNQLMTIPDGYWTLTVYVKVPTVAENKHSTFAMTILDRLGNHDGSQVAHTATFARSGSTLSAPTTSNLHTAGDDSASVMTSQAWDHSEEANGWYRLQMTYRGTTSANTAKGITRTEGDVGNPTNRFFNFWTGTSTDAPVERGQGWLIAWPQLEVASSATAYQRQAGHWTDPWGSALALLGGTLTHTFTVTS